MLILAIVLFVIAAIFGLFILKAILKDKPTPKFFVYLHGPVAAAAILLVIIYMYTSGASPLLLTSLTLFILAALGGLTLLTLDLSKKPIPKLLALLHPVIALAGLITLIMYVLQ